MTNPPDWATQIPNAPVHTPAGGFTPTRPSADEIRAMREQFWHWLISALVGLFIPGEDPWSQLSNWASLLQDAVDSTFDDLAALLDGILGTGHTMQDLVDWMQDNRDDTTQALTDLGTLITDLISGEATMADVVAYLQAVKATSDENADNFAALLDGILGTGHTIQDLVDWMQDNRDDTTQALTDLGTLITELFTGSATMDDVVAWLQDWQAVTEENQDNFAAILDGLLGTGHVIQDAVDWWQSLWSGQRSGTNLIPDPGLEDTTLDARRAPGITPAETWSYDTAQKHSATRSLKHVYPGSGYPGAVITPTLDTTSAGRIPVSPGMKFSMSQWVYDAPANTGNGMVQMFLEINDSTGTNPMDWVAIDVNTYYFTDSTWTKQYGYGTIPTGYDRMRPLFACPRPGNATGDTLWFDDFECYEVTESKSIIETLTGLDTGDLADLETWVADNNADIASALTDLSTLITQLISGQATMDDVVTYLQNVHDQSDENADNFAQILDGILGTGHTIQDMVDWWQDLFDNILKLFGIGSTRSKTGANIIANPSFDDTNFYFNTDNGFGLTTETAHSGTRCARCEANGTYRWTYITTDHTTYISVPVQPSDTWSFEAWVAGAGDNVQTSGGANGIQLGLQELDWAGNYIQNSFPAQATASTALNGVWTKLSGKVQLATNTRYIRPFLALGTNVTSGDVYFFDDVSVTNYQHTQTLLDVIVNIFTGGSSSNNWLQDMIDEWVGFFQKLFGQNTPQNQLHVPVIPDTQPDNLIVDGSILNTNIERPQLGTARAYYCTWITAHSGSNCIEMHGLDGATDIHVGLLPAAGTAMWNKSVAIKVQPFTRYYYELWVKAASGNAGGGDYGFYNVFYHSQNSNENWDGCFDAGYVRSKSNTAGGSDWSKLSGFVTVPAGYDRWLPYLYANNLPATDYVNFDDIVVRQASESFSVVDNIVNGLFGWTGYGWTHPLSYSAMEQQKLNTVSNAGQINALWSEVLSLGGITDNFTRDESDLGTAWTQYRSYANGYWQTDGSSAVLTSVYVYSDVDYVNIHDTDSVTDYQTIAIVLSSACTQAWYTYYGAIDVIGRSDNPGTQNPQNYLRFRVKANGTWSLAKIVGGAAASNIASGSGIANPGPGSILTLICGDKANSTPRKFWCKINDTVLADGVTDSTSAYGADYQFRGFGGFQDGDAVAVAVPAFVNSFSSYDTQ